MNYLDMSHSDIDYYNHFAKKVDADSDLNWILKNLAILIIAFVTITLLVGV